VVKDDSDRLSALREILRHRLGQERYALWLGAQTALVLEGETLTVCAASTFELTLLRRRLHETLVACYEAAWGAAPSIRYLVQAARCAPASPAAEAIEDDKPVVCRPSPVAAGSTDLPRPTGSARARTFDNFVVGACNQLAMQTGLDAARHPGRFSPLLFTGPPGCGKTHMLAAIEVEVRVRHGRVRALSLTAEQFTSQFVEALDRRALPGFRHKARSLDFLLVDDVQFFANKKATLDELLHTIDALQARGGQVVLASDRAAAELAEISPELASRVSSGLAVAIEPPDFAARAGIVRTMTARMQTALDDAVVELIANSVVGSGRMLAGAINRLVAVAAALGRPITVELAEAALAEFCRQHVPQVRLADIQRAVCDVFGVDGPVLRSARKSRAAAEPRMLAMWLARRYTRAALSEIGEFFGGRSHSTVVSAKKKFDGLITQGGTLVVGDRPCPVDEAIRRIELRLRTG